MSAILEINKAKKELNKIEKKENGSQCVDLKENLPDLRVLSLFSGGGGMDLGFEGGFEVLKASINDRYANDFVSKDLGNDFVLLKKLRFNTVFANDIFNQAKETWTKYFSSRGKEGGIYRSESIVDLVKLHKSGRKVFPKNIDVVTGGFPCQDFSISGSRNGFESKRKHDGTLIEPDAPTEETRGKLYMWMKEVIEITKPKIFIAENVKGLVNLSNVKEIIQSDFSSAGGNGYIVLEPKVLHSANYGISQNRERVFFIGIRKSALKKKALKELLRDIVSEEYNPYPKPTHSFNNLADNNLVEFVKLKEVLIHLGEPQDSSDLSHRMYSKAKFMGVHCQGQTEVNLERIAPTIRAEHHGNIEFRRLSELNGGILVKELANNLPERRLSIRECASIQTFPRDYEFVIKDPNKKNRYVVSMSEAYKVIGNAVPPFLAFHLALRIQELWGIYFKK